MQDVYAARAARAYVAMQRRFHMRSGLYRRDEGLHLPGAPAHLWPFSRAFFATLDVCGIPGEILEDIDRDRAIADELAALEHYWDPVRQPPAYSSDVRGSRVGGDRYYDDNAWVGLALVQLERLRPGSGHLERAEDVFRFAASGWDRRDAPHPGGVFWVEQGVGLGRANHDRNTVSNAPNAELGLHLAELEGSPVDAPDGIGPEQMYEWVVATLDAGGERGSPGTGLFWDKLRGDGTIDREIWSYNQGSMVGANVLLARRGEREQAVFLPRAEAIARTALRYFAGGYERQPAAFNAIFFRNLLLLHAATDDEDLRREITEAVRDYVDRAWEGHRNRRDLFSLPNGGVTLLNQSAMVQLLALLAWAPSDYAKLA
jgi:Glycosyl hydrolase family 76